MESNRAARTMFDTLSENCIFYISQLYEFSHRLGHSRPSGRCHTIVHVTFTPKADKRTDVSLSLLCADIVAKVQNCPVIIFPP
jgi:hypothetical protein